MAETSIEWTEATWNPIVGCSIATPGCTNCYAMRMAARIEAMGTAAHYCGTTKRVKGKAVWTGKLALAPDTVLSAPLRRRRPTTYFVNSMGDLFHEDCHDAWIDRVFAVMALSSRHTFQVLTKRAGRMQAYVSTWFERLATEQVIVDHPAGRANFAKLVDWSAMPKVLPNVWLGVSTERQQEANQRIPLLLQTAAAVRFISAEPLLGPIDLKNIPMPQDEGLPCSALHGHEIAGMVGNCVGWIPPLDWVIVGGESGPRARPMDASWVESLRAQCEGSEAAFFFKQWGGKNKKAAGRVLNDRTYDEMPDLRM